MSGNTADGCRVGIGMTPYWMTVSNETLVAYREQLRLQVLDFQVRARYFASEACERRDQLTRVDAEIAKRTAEGGVGG